MKANKRVTWKLVVEAFEKCVDDLAPSEHFDDVEWDLEFDDDDKKHILSTIRNGKVVEVIAGEGVVEGMKREITLYIRNYGTKDNVKIKVGCPYMQIIEARDR